MTHKLFFLSFTCLLCAHLYAQQTVISAPASDNSSKHGVNPNIPLRLDTHVHAEIYSAVLKKHFAEKPVNLRICEYPMNGDLLRTNFLEYIHYYGTSHNDLSYHFGMDSSWLPILKIADSCKHQVKSVKIPQLYVTPYYIQVLPKDSIQKGNSYGESTGYFHKIIFSDIIIVENRAIVGFERYTESFDGEGLIFFLRKTQSGWIVDGWIGRWMS